MVRTRDAKVEVQSQQRRGGARSLCTLDTLGSTQPVTKTRSAMERVPPKITTRSLLLELDRFDAAFDHLFVAQLSVIGPNALWIAVGAAVQPSSLMADTAVAMPVSPPSRPSLLVAPR